MRQKAWLARDFSWKSDGMMEDAQWKQSQVMWEEHRDVAPHCWEKILTGKAQLESKLPKLQRKLIFFQTYKWQKAV